ncbi:MAG: arsenate reductase ArsC [Candidatus Caldatribacteriota bacterium]|nr:arsenate reductase ArsC [Candidatus Caldatribacteriota bacterium]
MSILKKGILFLCTGNSCRSQMAEGFARNMLLESVKIFSAGTDPNEIHPIAIKVMQEVGIDISEQKSKNLWEIPVDKISIVVTLCGDAAERCPVFPGEVKKINWILKDPVKATGNEEEIINEFRKVRDKIKIYLEKEKWFSNLKR